MDVGSPIIVESHSVSIGPVGTVDQGGNVTEWVEDPRGAGGRGFGGFHGSGASLLRDNTYSQLPPTSP